MKIRLLTALIAATCFSQAASAAQLNSGVITNQTTATTDVVFNQPITLENTLRPIAGLKAGQELPDNSGIPIATGKLAIKEAGVTARLALKVFEADNSASVVYAEGHQGEEAYALAYAPVPDDADASWDGLDTSDGRYVISPKEQNQFTYKVMGAKGSTDFGTPKAGKYTISVTGAVYNP